jgi:hypothetical protein
MAWVYNSASFRVSNACWWNLRHSFSGNDWQAQCWWTNSYTYANIWPATTGLNSSNGIWRIYSSSDTPNNIFHRGGNASLTTNAGIFALKLYGTETSQERTLGFRCSL